MKAYLIIVLLFLPSMHAMQQLTQEQLDNRLYVSVVAGNTPHVQWYIDAGANVNFQQPRGKRLTLLHTAARNGHTQICSYLIHKGANINALDERGDTPLMRAIKEKISPAYKVFLDAGADTSIANKKGKTALVIAQEYGNEEAVEALRKK